MLKDKSYQTAVLNYIKLQNKTAKMEKEGTMLRRAVTDSCMYLERLEDVKNSVLNTKLEKVQRAEKQEPDFTKRTNGDEEKKQTCRSKQRRSNHFV